MSLSKLVPAGACWCSSDALYEHQPPVPIAHFGGRLRVTTCERRDVPGVLPGVIGTEQSRGWVWLFVCTSRNPTSGTPLLWHESLCHAVMAENHFEPQNFVAEIFSGGVLSLW